MAKIHIISGSNRQGRGTPQVAAWVLKTAQAAQTSATFELVDLADFDLPFMTEGYPPQNNPDRQTEGDVKLSVFGVRAYVCIAASARC